MYLKICGSIMIIAASAFIGYMYGERTKREIDIMKSLLRCIKTIESEIRYAGTPIKEIFRLIAGTGELWSDFFGGVSDKLNDNGHEGMTVIWDDVLSGNTVSRNMGSCDRREFVRFFGGLGKSDIESELGRIKLYTEYIRGRIEALSKEEADKVKLFRVLGVTAGLFITILIL